MEPPVTTSKIILKNFSINIHDGWLVGWSLTALLTQNRSYRACRFVGIFYSKL